MCNHTGALPIILFFHLHQLELSSCDKNIDDMNLRHWFHKLRCGTNAHRCNNTAPFFNWNSFRISKAIKGHIPDATSREKIKCFTSNDKKKTNWLPPEHFKCVSFCTLCFMSRKVSLPLQNLIGNFKIYCLKTHITLNPAKIIPKTNIVSIKVKVSSMIFFKIHGDLIFKSFNLLRKPSST